ncbi:MAG: hypothetical protein HY069_04905 [Chlamydiia bacterium]|nr:hypothetical protein [Chlamydiia bacterium]
MKQKRWQWPLILAVITLTLYNILPTIFYYSQPLHEPLSTTQAEKIIDRITKRVNDLEQETIDWLSSFCELIHVKPLYIRPHPTDSQCITLNFSRTDEANRFRSLLPRAGSLIPFVPAKLTLAPQEGHAKEVAVQRMIPIALERESFAFARKGDPFYRELMIDRATQIAFALAGPTDLSIAMSHDAYIEALATRILGFADSIEKRDPVALRYAASFTQGNIEDKKGAIQNFIAAFDRTRDALKKGKSQNPADLAMWEERENRRLKAEKLRRSFSQPIPTLPLENMNNF